MFSRLTNGFSRHWVWLILLFLVLAAATIPRFDGLYGQDAYAYYGYAMGGLRDFLTAGESFPGFFWPPGYPLLVTLMSFVVGQTPLAGQLVSLAAATLTPLFTYLLAQELRPHDKTTPFAAALLVALTGQLWQSALVVMADTTGLAFATCGMWAVARYGRTHRGRWLILAAATLAYALLTRWGYGLVAIPATLYVLYITFGGRELVGTQGNSGELSEQSTVNSEQLPVTSNQLLNTQHSALSPQYSLLLAAALTVILIMSPVLYALLTRQMDPATGHPAFTGDLGVYSWNPLNAFRNQFHTADGLLSYQLPTGLFYALTPAFPYYFTPLLAWLIFPGVWVLMKERAAASLFLILGWAGIVLGFHIGAPYQNFRFALAYLPPLAIAAAVGLVNLSKQLPVTSNQSSIQNSPFTIHHLPFQSLVSSLQANVSRIISIIFATGLLLMILSGLRLINTYISNKDRDLATVQWVENQTEPDSNLICFGLTATFQQYSHLHTYEIYHLDSPQMSLILAENRATYVLIDVYNINQQWSQLAPGLNWQWLQTNAIVTRLSQTGSFTLFYVSPLPE